MTASDDAFEASREIRLPQPADFYLQQRQFPFGVATSACAKSMRVGDTDVTLAIAPELKPHVERFNHAAIEASLADVTDAAMQFYQGEDSTSWPADQAADKLHMLRYDVGLAFGATTTNSIALVREGVLHGEAKKPVIELLGYGLAIIAAARLLKIGTDRFVFLLGADSRPDFAASISAADLVADQSMTKVITGDGLRVGLEAKARSQHKADFFKTRGDHEGEPDEELASMIRKYAKSPKGEAFLGMRITSEKRQGDGGGETRIVLADPGPVTVLTPPEQAAALLHAMLPRFRRIGVWGTLHAGAEWLEALGEVLSDAEKDFLSHVPNSDAFLVREDFMKKEYRGRIFSDVLRRNGSTLRRPLLGRAEIQRRLADADAGPLWFCGVQRELSELIRARHVDALNQFGIGENAAPAVLRRPIRDDAFADAVLRELAQALPYAT